MAAGCDDSGLDATGLTFQSEVVAEIHDYVVEVARRLSAAMGKDLVDVYLHGSAAMDAFVPSRSDVECWLSRDGRSIRP